MNASHRSYTYNIIDRGSYIQSKYIQSKYRIFSWVYFTYDQQVLLLVALMLPCMMHFNLIYEVINELMLKIRVSVLFDVELGINKSPVDKIQIA